jgi:hypothetical protein
MKPRTMIVAAISGGGLFGALLLRLPILPTRASMRRSQRHDFYDAALAVIVDAHCEIDVFDADDEKQRQRMRDRDPRIAAASGLAPVRLSTVLNA